MTAENMDRQKILHRYIWETWSLALFKYHIHKRTFWQNEFFRRSFCLWLCCPWQQLPWNSCRDCPIGISHWLKKMTRTKEILLKCSFIHFFVIKKNVVNVYEHSKRSLTFDIFRMGYLEGITIK